MMSRKTEEEMACKHKEVDWSLHARPAHHSLPKTDLTVKPSLHISKYISYLCSVYQFRQTSITACPLRSVHCRIMMTMMTTAILAVLKTPCWNQRHNQIEFWKCVTSSTLTSVRSDWCHVICQPAVRRMDGAVKLHRVPQQVGGSWEGWTAGQQDWKKRHHAGQCQVAPDEPGAEVRDGWGQWGTLGGAKWKELGGSGGDGCGPVEAALNGACGLCVGSWLKHNAIQVSVVFMM